MNRGGGDDGLRELLTRRLYDNIESELLREQLLATSAESPAEAFVKSLFFKEPSTAASKSEELLREQLAAAEARAAAAEASLASFKESAANDAAPQSEVEALREQDKLPGYAKGLLRRLSECDDDEVQIFDQCIDLDETELRVPPASPTPGAARDRPSASQVPPIQQDHRPDPDRDRPAHEAEGAASSPCVPDARRGARPTFVVAGGSTATRSTARSRPRSACSRR